MTALKEGQTQQSGPRPERRKDVARQGKVSAWVARDVETVHRLVHRGRAPTGGRPRAIPRVVRDSKPSLGDLEQSNSMCTAFEVFSEQVLKVLTGQLTVF